MKWRGGFLWKETQLTQDGTDEIPCPPNDPWDSVWSMFMWPLHRDPESYWDCPFTGNREFQMTEISVTNNQWPEEQFQSHSLSSSVLLELLLWHFLSDKLQCRKQKGVEACWVVREVRSGSKNSPENSSLEQWLSDRYRPQSHCSHWALLIILLVSQTFIKLWQKDHIQWRLRASILEPDIWIWFLLSSLADCKPPSHSVSQFTHL
jgi:hypothetical protein